MEGLLSSQASSREADWEVRSGTLVTSALLWAGSFLRGDTRWHSTCGPDICAPQEEKGPLLKGLRRVGSFCLRNSQQEPPRGLRWARTCPADQACWSLTQSPRQGMGRADWHRPPTHPGARGIPGHGVGQTIAGCRMCVRRTIVLTAKGNWMTPTQRTDSHPS